MKDKKWLLDALDEKEHFFEGNQEETYESGLCQGFYESGLLARQLEEPEITEEEAWNKIAETLPMSTVELRNVVSNVAFGYKPKEPQWVVKRENGDYVDYFGDSVLNIKIDLTSHLDATAPHRFTDKSKAEAVALLIGGEVEEVKRAKK